MMLLLREPASWLRLPSWPPGWDGLHPSVVHFAVSLLLIVPVFVFFGMILFRWGRWMSFSALLLWGMGLLAVSAAQSTGLAARDYLDQSSIKLCPEAIQVLEKHQQLASTLLPLYGALFVIYLVLFLLSLAVRPFDNPVWMFFMNLAFLILLALAGLVLVNTGELGGRLVHEFGIQARIAPIRPKAEKPPTPAQKPQPADEIPLRPKEKAPVPQEKPKPEELEKPSPPEEKPFSHKKIPEEKSTPPEAKPTPLKEKPTPEQKSTPPEAKSTPPEAEEKRQPSTPPEQPVEKPLEKAGPESPEAPAKETPSEKSIPPEPAEKPAADEKTTEKSPGKPVENESM